MPKAPRSQHVTLANMDVKDSLIDLHSVLQPPHQQARTILPRPVSRPPRRDLENLFGDAVPPEETTTRFASESLQMNVATATNGLSETHPHQTPTSASSPATTSSKEDDLGHLYQNLPRDAKIGIIVGIVAIVFLSLLGCGMCFLDCRRRTRKRKEQRENVDTQSEMLEMQMRNEEMEKKPPVHKGLWDHLKPVSGSREAITSNTATENTQDITRHDSITTTRNDTAANWTTSHSSRDRASVVSSVPSSISSSAGGVPALPTNFIDGGARR